MWPSPTFGPGACTCPTRRRWARAARRSSTTPPATPSSFISPQAGGSDVRAAVLEDVGRPLVIRDLPDPEPGPRDVVVRVRASGVCGSDLHTSDTFVPPG